MTTKKKRAIKAKKEPKPKVRETIRDLGYSKKDSFINFNSRHAAIQACLEVLGSRVSALPVILPACAPVEILSAVLRAGAVPYPVDIEATDYQMNRKGLTEALAALENAVVIFPLYCMQSVAPDLLEIAKEQITIAVHDRYTVYKRPKTKKAARKPFDCVFNIGYYPGKLNKVARVYSNYEQQLKDLVVIRDGELGLYADPQDYITRQLYNNYTWYLKRLKQEVIPLLFDPGTNECTYCAFQVPTSATGIVTSLDEIKVKARVLFKPLYDIPSIKARWPSENSNFPELEKVKDTVIAIDFNDNGGFFYDKVFDEATNIIWGV